jgi:putative cardiolipin synthase
MKIFFLFLLLFGSLSAQAIGPTISPPIDQMTLVTRPEQALEIRRDLIEHETEEIFADFNIWEPTGVAGALLGTLCEKARSGVRVRIVTDGLSANFWDASGIDSSLATSAMKACRFHDQDMMEIRFWNPGKMSFPFDYFKSRKLHRDHDKILFLKGQGVVYSGDRNWQNVNYRASQKHGELNYTYFSVDAVVTGALTRDVEAYLEEVWANSVFVTNPTPSKAFADDLHRAQSLTTLESTWRTKMKWFKAPTAFLHFNPRARRLGEESERDLLMNADLVALIDSARSSVILSTPYLRLSDDLYRAIENKRAQGIRVQLMTSKPDSRIIPKIQFQNRDINRLRKIGVDIWQKNSTDDLHAKMIIVDGQRAFFGSHNLNMRATFMDLEAGFLIDDEAAASILVEFALANSIPYEFHKTKLATQSVETILKLCSFCRRQI